MSTTDPRLKALASGGYDHEAYARGEYLRARDAEAGDEYVDKDGKRYTVEAVKKGHHGALIVARAEDVPADGARLVTMAWHPDAIIGLKGGEV